MFVSFFSYQQNPTELLEACVFDGVSSYLG